MMQMLERTVRSEELKDFWKRNPKAKGYSYWKQNNFVFNIEFYTANNAHLENLAKGKIPKKLCMSILFDTNYLKIQTHQICVYFVMYLEWGFSSQFRGKIQIWLLELQIATMMPYQPYVLAIISMKKNFVFCDQFIEVFFIFKPIKY